MGKLGSRAAAAALALLLGACAPIVRNYGYVPTDTDLAALAVGVDTRDSVIAAVGRPSTGGVLGADSFYYVQSRFRTLGVLEPEEVERQVLAITFGPDGTLGNIERFGLEEGRVVALSRRTTDRIFADTTFVRQVLGNVGRIDAAQILGDDGAEP